MFRDLVPFERRRDVQSFFDKMFGDDFAFPSITTGIKVDVKENEREYIVEAEVPGVDKDEINIDYNNNYLTISVERKEEVHEDRENYIRKERKLGKTSRSFYVENVIEDQIQARYNNGILRIVLPKSEEYHRRTRIDIQ